MAESLFFESDDVYETPLLAEVGDFVDRTRGPGGDDPEGPGTQLPAW